MTCPLYSQAGTVALWTHYRPHPPQHAVMEQPGLARMSVATTLGKFHSTVAKQRTHIHAGRHASAGLRIRCSWRRHSLYLVLEHAASRSLSTPKASLSSKPTLKAPPHRAQTNS
eukprot:4543543-Amphidinium_carterae.2